MTSKKQGQKVQWNQAVPQKMEEVKQRTQASWERSGRSQKPAKRRYARVFTGCTY